MAVQWDKLEVNLFAAKETLEGSETFIVAELHFWFNPRAVRLLCSVL